MGAGHDGAARTLAEQLRERGHVAEVKDFLESGPLRIGSALRAGYEFELRHVPSAYDATYRLWYRVPWLCPAVAWLVTFLTRRRVLRWVDDFDPWAVVSTYPLSTLCLGRLRRTGRLTVPAINFITDFGVHPLWVHRGVDANLAIHSLPAEVAARRTGRRSVFTGPAVSERFDPDRRADRAEARRRFGIADGERAVLVVAGSWGVGNLAATFRAIAADGRFVPVVVCGRDERLVQHLEGMAADMAGRAVILGWTDEMPALMTACDGLVENAGGLTSLEAMRVGLPVVSFDPIAGHGVENTDAMDAAGVATLAGTESDLVDVLARLTQPGATRDGQIERASAMFRSAPAETVLEVAAQPVAAPSTARRRAGRAARATVAVTSLAALGWGGLTTGVAMATDAGAGVAHPSAGSGPVAFVGVRLTAAQLADPVIDNELQQMNVTAVIDDATAQAAAGSVRALVGRGVTVADGGFGNHSGADHDGTSPWQRATQDARAGREISDLIDAPVTQTVPGRRLTAWDLVACRDQHLALVVPNHILHVDRVPAAPIHLTPRDIYLVNGMGATPRQMATFLSRLRASLGHAQLVAAPLATLA